VEEGNKELMDACDRFPEKLYGLATLTPFGKREDLGYQGLASGRFKAIRIYPAYHGFPLANSATIIEAAEATGVPVVIPFRLIMNWELPTLSFAEIVSVVRASPKVPFVVSCLNYEAYALLSLRERPQNLHIETSCLQQESATEDFAALLGPDKVLLGTGTPAQYAQPGIQKILNSRLDEKQKAMVTHQNAARLFRV